MNKLLFLTFFMLHMGMWSSAQKFTINGYAEDAATGEKLIGANIYNQKTYAGTTTNTYGFYSITQPGDSLVLIASYIGYQSVVIPIRLLKDTTINISLQSTIELKEVQIIARKSERIEERTQMSTIEISMADVKSLPAFMGERDLLKTIQLMPGVQSGGEGTTGLYVRGGGPDQNLILLDGVPVYNASHLFGFFSVFNPDAINSVQLIKGGFPARFGGRLSSVIDIRMKEGNTKKMTAEGTIGLVASKLTLEGPVYKDKTSFIISGRRTYIDLLAQPFIKMASGSGGGKFNAGFYFYDLNTKINHKFSEQDRLYLSAYMGNDKAYFRFSEKYVYDDTKYTSKMNAGLGWGNITTALRWNRIINKKLFANTTLTYSRYRFFVRSSTETVEEAVDKNQTEMFSYEYFSGIEDWAGKMDFDYLPSPNHYIRFGAGETYHTFTPGVNAFKSSVASVGLDTSFGASRIHAHEFYAYAEDDIKMGARLKANIGMHFSGFLVRGEQYYSFQPRVSARYLLSENWSVKTSYASMAQFIHLLTNASIGMPTDLWVPVTDTIRPMLSKQGAAGIAHTFKKSFEISVEGYYKTMNNLIEYKDGASFFSTSGDEWQSQVESGTGWSYGTEVFIQKKRGKATGWIGYTLSWANRQFQELNFGRKFPYRFDRRHDVSIAITYKLRDNMEISGNWVYGTGNAVTLASQRYLANTPALFQHTGYYDEVQYFEARNDFRMEAYHRLDLGVNFHKKKKWGERTWSVGVYNAYNRRNPFYLYFGHTDTGNRALKKVALFPIIPSISYSFKFL